MDRPELLTAEEAAQFLRLDVNTVRRYIRERRLPAAKIGRSYLIRADDLEAFLKQRTLAADEMSGE